MVLKVCHRCKKEFNTTQHYVRHLQRKRPCIAPEGLDNDQGEESNADIKMSPVCNQKVTTQEEEKPKIKKPKKIKIYKCDVCSAVFNHRQNKYAHMKTCKKVLEKDKNNKIKELNQKIRELRLQKRIVVVNKLDVTE